MFFNSVISSILSISEATLKYSKKCDIKGTIKFELNKFNPYKLEVRNLGKYQSLVGKAKFSLSMKEVNALIKSFNNVK